MPSAITTLARFAPLVLLVSASPALANAGAQVPEGSNLTLFALGVMGVIVGRRFSRKRKDRDPD